jgi:DHA3 family macrolide efflux protein-like MFS transporter
MKENEYKYLSYLFLHDISFNLFRILFFWYVISKFGGESLSALLAITTMAGFFLLQICAPISDIYNKAKILGLASILNIPFFLSFSYSTSLLNLEFYFLAALFFATSLLSAISGPPQNSILPEITSPNRAPVLIRHRKSLTSTIAIIAPIVSGYIGSISTPLGFFISASLMLLCATLITSIKTKNTESAKKTSEENWITLIKEGWLLKRYVRIEFWFTASTSLINTLITPYLLIIPLTIKNKFNGELITYGAAESLIALGSLVSASIILPLLNRTVNKFWICSLGILVAGLGIMISTLINDLFFFFSLVPLIGSGIAIFSLCGQSHRILATPQNKRSRISAIDLSLGKLTKSLGLIMTGALLTVTDPSTLSIIYGAVIVLLSALFLFIPDWDEFMNLGYDELEGYFDKKYQAKI